MNLTVGCQAFRVKFLMASGVEIFWEVLTRLISSLGFAVGWTCLKVGDLFCDSFQPIVVVKIVYIYIDDLSVADKSYQDFIP